MISEEALYASLNNNQRMFLDKLCLYTIVDIGIINSVTAEGRVTVTSSSYVSDKPLVYENVEIIYPGRYIDKAEGAMGLIFVPKGCVPSITEQRIKRNAKYRSEGIKVLPINNGVSNNVFTSFEGDSFNIVGMTYRVQCSTDAITFQRTDGKSTIVVDGSGNVFISSNTYNRTIDEEGIVTEYTGTGEDPITWVDTITPAGVRTFTQKKGDTAQFTMTIDASGKLSFSVTGDLDLSSDGDIHITSGSNKKVYINDQNLVVE